MIALALILIPLSGALFSALWPRERSRPWIFPVFAFPHTALCFWAMVHPPRATPGAWIAFDALAASLLPAISLLFLVCSFYAPAYLAQRRERPNRVFTSVLLAVLGLISAGHLSRHLGVLWIATEAVTLACVPLLHFNNSPRAFEATWKYLLVGGTGIALSLLGSLCLGYASLHGGGSGDLTFQALAGQGALLSRPWLLLAWTLLLAGYGTKMGLVPMHTWKPDAYGEAPGLVGALLAGGVTSVAFSALLRIRSVLFAAGEAAVADRTLATLGLLSMAVAACFLLGTRDFKRMLAYSSIEHMGILSLAASLGPPGVFAALFHVWGNAFSKGCLFLSAGNFRRVAGDSSLTHARGLGILMPRNSFLFATAFFAITACPPFAPFFSELRVLQSALRAGKPLVGGAFLICLLFAFFGMCRIVFTVTQGRPSATARAGARAFPESAAVLLPPFVLLLLSLALGLHLPALLENTWLRAVAELFPAP